MDEATERKIRDLKLQILKTEKELTKTQSSANLGAWLRAGHAGQIHRHAERDRQRLETKLDELKTKLEEIAPGSRSIEAKPNQVAPKAGAAPTEPTATKKAAAKKPAAKITTRS